MAGVAGVGKAIVPALITGAIVGVSTIAASFIIGKIPGISGLSGGTRTAVQVGIVAMIISIAFVLFGR